MGTARSAFIAAAVALVCLASAVRADGEAEPARSMLERGWAALRAMDCARCHGRHYDGWSAPDLIAAVREGSRERFDRFVLDGEIQRGMPGYASQALVRKELDAIYAYLRARADGAIAAGRPTGGPLP